jgi:hypothetical protein
MNMNKPLVLLLLTWTLALGQDQKPQQTWSGTLSDSMCAASHKLRAGNLSDRECIFECIKALAKYVLVDDKDQVIPIANQDLGGFPLYAGRPVKITGDLKDGAIVATRIEAIPAHLHLGHVMTNWRDTPGNSGFLIAAISDARVAATHADLAAKSPDLESMQLHAGHVLNALDSSIEPKGPGSGYSVKKAATNALQHLELAVNAEGTNANIKTHAASVSASLNNVLQWTDQAISTAQKIRSAKSPAEAAPLANELAAFTKQISETGLRSAKTGMDLLMRGEKLENAPK